MNIQESLGYLLNVSARLIKRNLDNQLKQYDLTTTQWAVIKLLSEHNNLTQAQIAESLNSDRATSGTVIDKLIQKKLVEKKLDKNDRRSYIVTLLPQTFTIIKDITNKATECNKQAIQGLSDSDIKNLALTLEIIIKNLGGDK